MFKDYPNTTTPLGENFLNGILNMILPIGKVEMFYDDDDHSNYMGFTWERTLIGKTPIGIDSNDTDFDTIGNTGGEKNHTLTVDEMPIHDHQNFYVSNDGNRNPAVSTYSGDSSGVYAKLEDSWESGRGPLVSGGSGGNQSHNILQPYEVVAFWKRIA